MLEPWNNRAILPPPINTFLCKNNKDIRSLRYNTNNIIQVLTKQSPLHQESAVCSRFLYKFDKKFRNDIGYRSFKKVNSALKKYLSLNLLKDIQRFVSLLPNKDDELYLPTRQMMEYVLVRIMSFSKLMLRIVICAKQAAVFYLDRIKRGESHWMCLMPYALLSRIWSMAQVLLQHSCNWYNQLHPLLKILEPKGLNFLPPDYKMPDDLELWCDLKNLNEYGNFEWTHKIKIKVEPMILDESDGDGNFCDSIFELANQINEKTVVPEDVNFTITTIKETPNETNIYSQDNDIGVPVSRENIQTNVKIVSREISQAILEAQVKETVMAEDICVLEKRESKHITYIHSIDNVSNNNSLKEFIDIEEKYRNKNKDKALTGHLSVMQWLTLKSSLLKLTEDGCLPRKLIRKIQKIWHEKCLYYK
ncbi:nucleolus and neural progenitor protein-like [Pieris rapae]|uniref:nucleolus and neural progenitor protein-like n=1 Tax=Pieris rapae TaxID=64459 RepID=UPI001E27A325|nr:nucleolus and neural progenitor protein-like [Pieris rapae]XP_045485389.1 nucleolus and neural progenitor protein-like [Pieris rapae]